MKSLRTLTAGERRRITDGDPADLDVVELLARREWDRLEFTRRAGLLIVRPMNGSSRGGVSVYSDDVTDSDAFFDPPTPLGVVRRDGACPTRPWLLESDYLDQRRHATLEDALRELAARTEPPTLVLGATDADGVRALLPQRARQDAVTVGEPS